MSWSAHGRGVIVFGVASMSKRLPQEEPKATCVIFDHAPDVKVAFEGTLDGALVLNTLILYAF